MEPIYNTVGAAKQLNCGVDNIHKLVSSGKLKARVYNSQGVLIEREQGKKQGQGLYFLQEDIDAFQRIRRRPGKPRTETLDNIRK